MRQELRKQLALIYDAPAPKKKRSFFRGLAVKPLGFGHILKLQFTFISKGSWLVSLLALGGIIIMNCFFEEKLLGAMLAVMPFLAIAATMESCRSSFYGMAELELAARFSLKSILLARMGIIGIENLALAALAAFFVREGFFPAMLYILVPYLATVWGSFQIVRVIPGWEGLYSSAALAAVVSVLTLFGKWNLKQLYTGRYFGYWLLATVILLCLTFRESRKIIRGEDVMVMHG